MTGLSGHSLLQLYRDTYQLQHFQEYLWLAIQPDNSAIYCNFGTWFHPAGKFDNRTIYYGSMLRWTDITMTVTYGTDLSKGIVQVDTERKITQITRRNTNIKWGK